MGGDFKSPLDINSEPSTPESGLLAGSASGGCDGSITDVLLTWLAQVLQVKACKSTR